MDLKLTQGPQFSFGSVDAVISRRNSIIHCDHGQKFMFDTRNSDILVLKKFQN